jgi:hypothetical protein
MTCAYNENFNTPNYNIENENNGDIYEVPDFAAMFTKTLEHDPVTGIATTEGQKNFERLVQATKNGSQETYNSIVRYPGSSKFVNPQASAAWSLQGKDTSLIPAPLPPKINTEEAGSEIAENYLMSIARGVFFSDYGTGTGTDVDTINGGSITQNACNVLNAYGSAFKGPKINGLVTPATLFRDNLEGCLVGPYISQFFYHDLYRYDQPLLAVKQHMAIAKERTFGITWDNFVAIQNGLVPVPYDESDFDQEHTRYISCARDAGTLVHYDMLSDPYVYAQNVLFNNPFPLAPNFPYNDGSITNEDAFATMWYADLSNLVGSGSLQGLKNAWAHKWRASLRLRPEAFAGLVHRAKVTGENPYGLNDKIFGSLGGIDLLEWVKSFNLQQTPFNEENGTYLLPLLYPEGGPNHPSYLAGHATVAGTTVTIMKAFLDDRALFKDYLEPVKPDPADPTKLVPLTDAEGANLLTVGGQLNLLASNIATGRNLASVHYRSDSDASLRLGEQVAICFLQDWASTYQEEGFNGYELTKFNGQRIRITATDVTVIS